MELNALQVFTLELICPQDDSLRVFDERTLECELEADSVAQV